MGKRGMNVFTDGNDEECLSKGILNAYTKKICINLKYFSRYS